jgi:hypothetical protein
VSVSVSGREMGIGCCRLGRASVHGDITCLWRIRDVNWDGCTEAVREDEDGVCSSSMVRFVAMSRIHSGSFSL